MKHQLVFIFVATAITACSKQNFDFQAVASSDCTAPLEKCPPLPSPTPPPGLYPPIPQDYWVDISGTKALDLLIVMDNSQSMGGEQQNMAARFSSLTTQLQDLDWRLSMTTTDIFKEAGRLVTYKGTSLKTIDKNTPNAQKLISDTIQMGTSGSGTEQGIYASNLAVDANEGGWIRPDSHFSVLVVSDENEKSFGTDLETYNQPSFFIQNVKEKLGTERSFAFHSIIALSSDPVCVAQDKNKAGTVYQDLTTKTGGVSGSICASDYSSVLDEIGKRMVEFTQSIVLKCEPISGTLKWTVEPTQAGLTANLIKDKLVFNISIEIGSRIHLEYDCPGVP